MNEEKLMPLLEKLAAKIGLAADTIWAALMRQAMISSFIDLLWVVLWCIALVWVIRYVKLVYRKVEKHEWDEISWLPCGLVIAFAGIVTLATISGLPMMVAGFFNPEYWAIHHLPGLK